MSATAVPSVDRPVFRKAVVFCVLPADLAHLRDALDRHMLGQDVEVVVERRAEGDRRRAVGHDPVVERRLADRRSVAPVPSAADLGLDLPFRLWRHAERIRCVQRMVPVHRADALAEARTLLTSAHDGDRPCREELRLRFHHQVHGQVVARVGRRRADDMADRVFDELFERAQAAPFDDELTAALRRALG